MSYTDQYEKAKEKGKVEEITKQIFTFTEDGEKLIGVVVDIQPFNEGDFDAEVNQYILDTDDGRVSCILGSATDSQLTGKEIKGKLVCVTFHGKKTLKDGRQVNRFKVEVF